ncbi:LOW QUALITY PROTEIN: 5-methyltetrahydropteroyltriglutamate--homocysteine methyltransferase-like [Saccoglossus kowalevskii]
MHFITLLHALGRTARLVAPNTIQCNVPLTTTVIGSYPKPDYLGIPDWFDGRSSAVHYNAYLAKHTPREIEELTARATKDVIVEQVELGIDVITDGEVRRENYIYYACRRIKGFDFNDLTAIAIRNGAWTTELPTIASKIGNKWAAEEWKAAQSFTGTPVKFTFPGPTTIMESARNAFYDDKRILSEDLVKVINYQIRALAKAGCRHIQLDEPVFARLPDIALDYGIEHAARCFDGISLEVEKTIHICCGYPCYLDHHDYQKADKDAYFQIIDKLDCAGFDAISLEDAHRHNDLRLLDRINKSKVVLGVIAIAKSRVETVEEIQNRLKEALRHITASRLMVSPDCGLGFLPRPILKEKLSNMVAAAKSIQ